MAPNLFSGSVLTQTLCVSFSWAEWQSSPSFSLSLAASWDCWAWFSVYGSFVIRKPNTVTVRPWKMWKIKNMEQMIFKDQMWKSFLLILDQGNDESQKSLVDLSLTSGRLFLQWNPPTARRGTLEERRGGESLSSLEREEKTIYIILNPQKGKSS